MIVGSVAGFERECPATPEPWQSSQNIPLDNHPREDYYPARMKRRTLRDEIQQTKAFPSLEAEVFLNVLRTAEAVAVAPHGLLRNEGLSHSQYNVLRILRGAGDSRLRCREIVDRMVTRDPDMTRLLDGLERKGLVDRNRSERDRRVIGCRISASGLELLAELDAPMQAVHIAQFEHLSEPKLKRLSRLLEEARQSPLVDRKPSLRAR